MALALALALDDCSSAVLCLVDEVIPHPSGGRRVRQRAPQPVLAARAVVTMDVAGRGELERVPGLGLEQDSMLFASFRQHDAHCFPALRTLHMRHRASSSTGAERPSMAALRADLEGP